MCSIMSFSFVICLQGWQAGHSQVCHADNGPLFLFDATALPIMGDPEQTMAQPEVAAYILRPDQGK